MKRAKRLRGPQNGKNLLERRTTFDRREVEKERRNEAKPKGRNKKRNRLEARPSSEVRGKNRRAKRGPTTLEPKFRWKRKGCKGSRQMGR